MEVDKHWVHSDYMRDNFQPRKFRCMAEDVADTIMNEGVKFDAIACRGVSGLMIAAPVALLLDKPLIVVRKSIEGSHSSFMVEGYLPRRLRYIIIDDFVETGDTIRQIIEEISAFYLDSRKRGEKFVAQDVATSDAYFRKEARCVGVFLYSFYEKDNLGDFNYDFFERRIHGPIMDIND